jgi:hypothetical protein
MRLFHETSQFLGNRGFREADTRHMSLFIKIMKLSDYFWFSSAYQYPIMR